MFRMTKKLLFIGMLFFSPMVVGGFEDPMLVEAYDPGPEFVGDFDEIPFGSMAFYRQLGLIDTIPSSIEYYTYGVEVVSIAMLIEFIEHFVNRISRRGRASLVPTGKTYERMVEQVAFFASSQLLLLNIEEFLDLKNKGTCWKFATLRFMQHGNSLAMTANVYQAIKEFIYDYSLPLQRSLIAEECPVCYEEKKIRVVPCGDERHHICVICYRNLVKIAQQYKCPFCARVMPEQKITVRKLSVYDKIQRLTLPEKLRVCLLLLGECIILYSIFLAVNEDFIVSSGGS